MRLLIIADAYPPMRSSAAVQLRDLSLELVRQGHVTTVVTPSSDLSVPWVVEEVAGVQVVRLRGPRTKDIGYVRRTLGELFLPLMMWWHLRQSPVKDVNWDGVIWYSPTIFLGPLVQVVKRSSRCRGYLILRDIFPEWAVDMGLLKRGGLPHRLFGWVERYQYAVADVIGVQTLSNRVYFKAWASAGSQRQLEVLQNWLADASLIDCSISVERSLLKGRTVFVYAGNMGVAQGMDILIDLAEQLRTRQDIGFLFVGRGSHVVHLRAQCAARKLDNTIFYDEIDPAEIPALYAQCHVGIVALDPRHKTHNIPGKFLSYMQSGLPVLACVNPGTDLVDLIEREQVGRVATDHAVETLKKLVEELVQELANAPDMSQRCKALSAKLFSSETAARQIVKALSVTC